MLSTFAVDCSARADEEWICSAVSNSMELADITVSEVVVVSADRLENVLLRVTDDVAIVVIGDPVTVYARAAHVITRAWPPDQIRVLLISLAARRPAGHVVIRPPFDPASARDAQRAIAAARKLLSATTLIATERTVTELLKELLDCDDAYCLFYDSSSAALWSEVETASDINDRNAVVGLSGFAARTGEAAQAARVGDDPRFSAVNDCPDADGTARVLAQPVLCTDGKVHGVFIVARRGKRMAFNIQEAALLARFAQVVRPVFDHLSLQIASQVILDENNATETMTLFRREARDEHSMPRWGDVIRVTPGWLPWTYRCLVVLLAGSFAFLMLGTVSTYSTGVAVIRSTARRPVIARVGGNVTRVMIAPGDRVALNDILARLDDTEQRASVERIDHEFETQLRNHMLDPGDASADASVRSLRHELDAARIALDERLVRSPTAGVIGDVRVRPSQRTEPGDIVASVVDNLEGLEVIALLPGTDRPQLTIGMSVRFELNGYRYAYQTFMIDSVSADVLSPNEARRVLGAEVADSFSLTGPVALVRGRLPYSSFVVDGQSLKYHDGMTGTAEVRTHAEPIIFAVVPATRRLRE